MINLNMHEGCALLLYDPNDKEWAVFAPDSRAHMGIGAHRVVIRWSGEVVDSRLREVLSLQQWAPNMRRLRAYRLTDAQVGQLEMIARHATGDTAWWLMAAQYAGKHLGEPERCKV